MRADGNEFKRERTERKRMRQSPDDINFFKMPPLPLLPKFFSIADLYDRV